MQRRYRKELVRLKSVWQCLGSVSVPRTGQKELPSQYKVSAESVASQQVFRDGMVPGTEKTYKTSKERRLVVELITGTGKLEIEDPLLGKGDCTK